MKDKTRNSTTSVGQPFIRSAVVSERTAIGQQARRDPAPRSAVRVASAQRSINDLLEGAAAACSAQSAVLSQRDELVRLVTGHLEAGDDRSIERALAAAPSLPVARTLRRAVEQAVETVRVSSGRVGVCRHLFCVGVLVRFRHLVSDSEVRLVFSQIAADAQIARQPMFAREGSVWLYPGMVSYAQLQRMSFSALRALANPAAPPTPAEILRGGEAPMRISRTFLRFLVGSRVRRKSPARPSLTDIEGIKARVMDTLTKAIGQPAYVAIHHNGRFYDQLYCALRHFQDARLVDIVEEMLHQAQGADRIVVSASRHGNALRHEPRVAFFNRGRLIFARVYRVRMPGYEDGERCCQRVVEVLQQAGVSAVFNPGTFPDTCGEPPRLAVTDVRGQIVPTDILLPL